MPNDIELKLARIFNSTSKESIEIQIDFSITGISIGEKLVISVNHNQEGKYTYI